MLSIGASCFAIECESHQLFSCSPLVPIRVGSWWEVVSPARCQKGDKTFSTCHIIYTLHTKFGTRPLVIRTNKTFLLLEKLWFCHLARVSYLYGNHTLAKFRTKMGSTKEVRTLSSTVKCAEETLNPLQIFSHIFYCR